METLKFLALCTVNVGCYQHKNLLSRCQMVWSPDLSISAGLAVSARRSGAIIYAAELSISDIVADNLRVYCV